MIKEAIKEMQAIHGREGTRAVLLYLNARTDHRFSALFRFDDETLRNLHFVDREQPDAGAPSDIPVTASYCVFVRESGLPFDICDSAADDRLGDHPKRAVIRSYCGVPLLDRDGRMFGTICHFDVRPLAISDDNVALMEAMAQLLKPGFN